MKMKRRDDLPKLEHAARGEDEVTQRPEAGKRSGKNPGAMADR